MLVITRKPGECIRIGDDIKIEIVSVKGKTIRVGIVADADTLILRDEIYERNQGPAKSKPKLDLPAHGLN